MRARWWLAAGVALVLVGCREERTPAPVPGSPPPPDVSDMNRAGIPEEQGAMRSGETGEGTGFPGEQSAVKELPAGEPINTGTPGARGTERPAAAPERR
jgi:hypothetical protein